MSQELEADVMEDLAAEGPALSAEEEFEETDALDESEDLDAMEEEDAFEEAEEFDALDELEDYGEDYGEQFAEEGLDEMEEAAVDALEADDTDEFFRRLARGVGRVARGVRRVAGRVGRIAAGPVGRIVGRVAGAIPLPWTQAIARAVPLLARLRSVGADELEALDEFADEAAEGEMDVDAAIPVIAGLAARSVLRRAGAALGRQARRQVVRGMGAAARTLVRTQGPAAIRALPRIVRSVRRKAMQTRAPARTAARTVARTAIRVARRPQAVRRLSRPLPQTPRRQAVRRRLGALGVPGRLARSFVLRGPVRINITGGV